MRHLHQEFLAGIALGDVAPISGSDRLHLMVCRYCAGELTGLRAIVATGREGMPYELLPPKPAVLAQIQAELAGDTSSAGQASPAVRSVTPPDDLASRRAASPPVRRLATLAIAAVALAAVSVGGVIWYRQAVLKNDDAVVARTTLQPLPDKSGQGTAELIRKGGVVQLSVTTTADRGGPGYEELWLINTDGQRMISLGILPPDGRGSYPLPVMTGGGLDGYTIVDISLEPLDGNTAHSHNSLLRGSLG